MKKFGLALLVLSVTSTSFAFSRYTCSGLDQGRVMIEPHGAGQTYVLGTVSGYPVNAFSRESGANNILDLTIDLGNGDFLNGVIGNEDKYLDLTAKVNNRKIEISCVKSNYNPF